MYEIKSDAVTEAPADALDAACEAAAAAQDVAALRGEVAQLRRHVDAGVVAAARPALAGAKADRDPAAAVFVDRYLRTGAEGVELKSFVGTADPAGGYAVPEQIDARIDRTLKTISPIRSLASVVKVGSAAYRKLVTTGGVASGWAAEDGARAETATPTFTEIVPPMGDLYANPAASQAMLDDAAFDVEEWLAGEIATEFARAEGAAFVNGTGVAQPRGFLTYPVSIGADPVRPLGTVQALPTGVAAGFAANAPQDRLVDLVQSLRAPYRQGAAFVMNSATLAAVRKFKTADGAFLWQPGLVEGQPDRLLGYPVVESEDMPDIAAGSLSIAFGNLRVAYLIAERAETQILRDPYTHKPFVHFYATKRLGGAIVNSEALKLLRFSAS